MRETLPPSERFALLGGLAGRDPFPLASPRLTSSTIKLHGNGPFKVLLVEPYGIPKAVDHEVFDGIKVALSEAGIASKVFDAPTYRSPQIINHLHAIREYASPERVVVLDGERWGPATQDIGTIAVDAGMPIIVYGHYDSFSPTTHSFGRYKYIHGACCRKDTYNERRGVGDTLVKVLERDHGN